MHIEKGSNQYPIVPYNRVTALALVPQKSLHQLQSEAFSLSKPPRFDVICPIHWNYRNDVKLIPFLPDPLSVGETASYDKIRHISNEFKSIAIERNLEFENQMQGFLKRHLDTPNNEDLDEGLKLLKAALSIERKVGFNAVEATTYYRVSIGRIANLIQPLVKQLTDCKWKDFCRENIKGQSYESLNIWKNVSQIAGVDRWLFLGIVKLNLLGKAIEKLETQDRDPILKISEQLDIKLTDDITESALNEAVELYLKRFPKETEDPANGDSQDGNNSNKTLSTPPEGPLNTKPTNAPDPKSPPGNKDKGKVGKGTGKDEFLRQVSFDRSFAAIITQVKQMISQKLSPKKIDLKLLRELKETLNQLEARLTN